MKFIGDKKSSAWGDWFRTVEHDGKTYRVGVRKASGPRRIAYSNKKGYLWEGIVYHDGKVIWSDYVPKSLGARGLLIRAGIFKEVGGDSRA